MRLSWLGEQRVCALWQPVENVVAIMRLPERASAGVTEQRLEAAA